MSQRVPRCPRCCPDQGLSGSPVPTTPTSSPAASTTFGIMKPDIVFFGEGLPYEFHTSLQEDVHQADLILVMGSSLKVRPVSHIPDSVVPEVPQILVNRESLPKHNFDTELLGDCDVILEDLCGRLGWNLDEDTDSASVGCTRNIH
ncbi:unnamed protein product [Mesocestoides corti]|uniref:Deacetylase sirtuin-type domain-containing protein n=2 Tax=Mesocestoides corti TaxID=53468 RepID=A0A0R3URK2_MESCO|nr:unnamed protein product [Mesocestoides corti]